MITLLVRTLHEDGARDVHGVIWFRYDPGSMDVSARHPDVRKPSTLVEERFARLRCVREISGWTGLPKLEVLNLLRSGENRILEVEPGAASPRDAEAKPSRPGGPPSGEGPPGPLAKGRPGPENAVVPRGTERRSERWPCG